MVQVIYNTLSDGKVERLQTRESLCSEVSPVRQRYFHLLVNADSLDDMRMILSGEIQLSKVLAEAPDLARSRESGLRSLDDLLYQRELAVFCDSFDL